MNLKEEKNMITILDVEHTVTTRDGKTHMDPFESNNKMVMVGVIANGREYIYNMNDSRVSYHTEIQSILHHTKLLVCHNVVHDLMWLWESNFIYNGECSPTSSSVNWFK